MESLVENKGQTKTPYVELVEMLEELESCEPLSAIFARAGCIEEEQDSSTSEKNDNSQIQVPPEFYSCRYGL